MKDVYETKCTYWVWLQKVLGTANDSFFKISSGGGYRDVEHLVDDCQNGRVKFLDKNQRLRAEQVSLEQAREIVRQCDAEGINITVFDDLNYPYRLRITENPPPVIYTRGDLSVLESQAIIAVSGTRAPCEYSLEALKLICTQLSQMNVTLITGIEPGIDVTASRTARENGKRTIALCGKGIRGKTGDSRLADEIAQNGLVLSEFTDKADFGAVRYTNRNRILCGLADGVLFAECSESSHSLDNAYHAKHLRKPVFVIPPTDIADSAFFGQRNLIRDGAIPVFDGSDILNKLHESDKATELDEIKFKSEPLKARMSDNKSKKAKKEEKSEKKIEKISPEDLHKSENSVTIDMSGFSESQKIICNELAKNGKTQINAMAENLKMPIGQLVTDLMMLQIKKVVKELPGRNYELNS